MRIALASCCRRSLRLHGGSETRTGNRKRNRQNQSEIYLPHATHLSETRRCPPVYFLNACRKRASCRPFMSAIQFLLIADANSLLMATRKRSRKTPSPAKRAKTVTRKQSTAQRVAERARWVNQTLREMPILEKLGQLLMVPFFGRFTSRESHDFQQLLRAIEEQHVGGFMLATSPGPLGILRAQVYPTAELTNELQDHARIPLLFGADFERGTVM